MESEPGILRPRRGSAFRRSVACRRAGPSLRGNSGPRRTPGPARGSFSRASMSKAGERAAWKATSREPGWRAMTVFGSTFSSNLIEKHRPQGQPQGGREVVDHHGLAELSVEIRDPGVDPVELGVEVPPAVPFEALGALDLFGEPGQELEPGREAGKGRAGGGRRRRDRGREPGRGLPAPWPADRGRSWPGRAFRRRRTSPAPRPTSA